MSDTLTLQSTLGISKITSNIDQIIRRNSRNGSPETPDALTLITIMRDAFATAISACIIAAQLASMRTREEINYDLLEESMMRCVDEGSFSDSMSSYIQSLQDSFRRPTALTQDQIAVLNTFLVWNDDAKAAIKLVISETIDKCRR